MFRERPVWQLSRVSAGHQAEGSIWGKCNIIFMIRKKLSLGVGTLTGLLLVSGLISYFQIHIAEERLVEVLEVDEPISATAYEMEINLIGTGVG